MRIVISPAKKMNMDTDSLPWQALPEFLPRTRILLSRLREMDYDSCKALWKCNDSLAQLNFRRLQTMDLCRNLTPAILSYEGIQYQYMAPGVFTDEEFSYIQTHLRILSGFYGLLRPMDGVTPYRLEMQARLSTEGCRDLYGFWGDALAKQLASETDCIINLASREYSAALQPHLPPHVRFLTCVFAEEKQGKLLEKGTLCKMARGEMVRFLAQNGITEPEEMKGFDRLGYAFRAELSEDDRLVFLRAPDSGT